MTNRQSNILFYSAVALFVIVALTNVYYPQLFEVFSKSDQELQIKEAMAKTEYDKALALYGELINEKATQGESNTAETAQLYQEIAKIYALMGNSEQEQQFYLKALPIRQQLQEKDRYSLAQVYHQLGLLTKQEKRWSQAQQYFEKSLYARLGDIEPLGEDEKGMFTKLQQQRINYKRLNHAETIATFQQLAEVFVSQENYKSARDYYQRALLASEQTFGEDSAEVFAFSKLIELLP
jgi:tetratricopeptide (TPR) repeat protein